MSRARAAIFLVLLIAGVAQVALGQVFMGSGGSGGVSGSGTANTLAMFTGVNSVGDSSPAWTVSGGNWTLASGNLNFPANLVGGNGTTTGATLYSDFSGTGFPALVANDANDAIRIRSGGSSSVLLGPGADYIQIDTTGLYSPIGSGAMNLGSANGLGWKGLYLHAITATASAPGATTAKLEVVCGTNAGTAKLIIYAGTSATPVTVTDNIGSGVTGC